MGFAERFEAESERASLAARCQVAQIDKNSHGPVVALGQFGGHESVDLAPQLVLTADEAVKVLLLGGRLLAISPGLLFRSPVGLHTSAFASIFLCRMEKLADRPPSGHWLSVAFAVFFDKAL
jgi:hypothetical protein